MYSIDRLEHLCSYKARITDFIHFGDTPLGKRYDAYFEGDLTGQKLSGKMQRHRLYSFALRRHL